MPFQLRCVSINCQWYEYKLQALSLMLGFNSIPIGLIIVELIIVPDEYLAANNIDNLRIKVSTSLDGLTS